MDSRGKEFIYNKEITLFTTSDPYGGVKQYKAVPHHQFLSPPAIGSFCTPSQSPGLYQNFSKSTSNKIKNAMKGLYIAASFFLVALVAASPVPNPTADPDPDPVAMQFYGASLTGVPAKKRDVAIERDEASVPEAKPKLMKRSQSPVSGADANKCGPTNKVGGVACFCGAGNDGLCCSINVSTTSHISHKNLRSHRLVCRGGVVLHPGIVEVAARLAMVRVRRHICN